MNRKILSSVFRAIIVMPLITVTANAAAAQEQSVPEKSEIEAVISDSAIISKSLGRITIPLLEHVSSVVERKTSGSRIGYMTVTATAIVRLTISVKKSFEASATARIKGIPMSFPNVVVLTGIIDGIAETEKKVSVMAEGVAEESVSAVKARLEKKALEKATKLAEQQADKIAEEVACASAKEKLYLPACELSLAKSIKEAQRWMSIPHRKY